MLSFFSKSQNKKAAQKLSEFGLTLATQTPQTNFRALALLVVNHINRKQKVEAYLSAMEVKGAGPELLLKYTVFVHILVQQGKAEDSRQRTAKFLAEILLTCDSIIQKRLAEEVKQIQLSRESRSISTRSEEVFLSKEFMLLSTVVKPYLAYLMRIVGASEKLGRQAGRQLEHHEAWKRVNLLRLIVSVTNSFILIGRYYRRSYGDLVVLLIRALSRDIYLLVEVLSQFIETKRRNVVCSKGFQAIIELVKMLQEVSRLSDQLLIVYLGKYFYDQVKDLQEPPWVNANQPRFDTLFKLYRSQKD